MGQQNNFYQDSNGKPTQPPDEPIEPNEPDKPDIGDPEEPTDPEDPIPEPVKANRRPPNRYDPNDLQNYVRLPGRDNVH